MPHDGQLGVYFDSDGCRLLGTLFLAKGDDPKPTAILLHGVPGIEKNYDIAHALRDHGWNALIFHYRGCWGSDGLYHLRNLPTDAHAAIAYLRSGTHPQVDTQRISLIGHSIGGMAAIMAAIDDPKLYAVQVYGAVCDPRTIRLTYPNVLAEYAPWLPGISASAFINQWASLDEDFTPTLHIQKLTMPCQIIHGMQDSVIPFEQADTLVKNAGEGCYFFPHPEANHSFTWHRAELRSWLLSWLDTLGND